MISENGGRRVRWTLGGMCFHLYLVSLLEYSISYSVSRPPSPNSLPPFFSFSDVIVSCSVDAAAAQLKAECTDPKRIL